MKDFRTSGPTLDKAAANSAGSADNKDLHRPTLLLGVAVGSILGFAAALIFCYFTWVRDLQVHLSAKEKALTEWAELNRQERSTVESMKNMSVDELKQWVAAANEQSTYFMDMQRRLNQLEVALTGPGTTYIVLGVMALLGVVVPLIFWVRSADHAAATALEQVVGLAPEAMVRAVLVQSLALRKEPLTIAVDDQPSFRNPKLPPAPEQDPKNQTSS